MDDERQSAAPGPKGEFTQLLDQAVRGDGGARDRLYQQMEPRARRVAERVIERQGGEGRLRVTEVIDEVFADLILPTTEGGRWDNHIHFYACVGRRTFQIVVNLLRQYRGVRDRDAVVEILENATAEPAFLDRLGDTAGDASKIDRLLSDLIASPEVAGRIMKERGDPSKVVEAVRPLWRDPAVTAQLGQHGGDAPGLRQVIVAALRQDAVRRRLTLVRPTGSLAAREAGGDDPPDAGAGEVPAAFPHFTIHSLLTAYEALEDMDDYFAPQAAAEAVTPPRVEVGGGSVPLNTELEPPLPVTDLRPRSLNGQIIYLRMIGWTWDEIAKGLGRPLATVYNRARSAAEYLRDKLGGDFRGMAAVLAPSP